MSQQPTKMGRWWNKGDGLLFNLLLPAIMAAAIFGLLVALGVDRSTAFVMSATMLVALMVLAWKEA